MYAVQRLRRDTSCRYVHLPLKRLLSASTTRGHDFAHSDSKVTNDEVARLAASRRQPLALSDLLK